MSKRNRWIAEDWPARRDAREIVGRTTAAAYRPNPTPTISAGTL